MTMRFLTIDCSGITDKAGFHEAVAQVLEFPSWYGKNLDALHDCLTEVFTDTQLQFENWNLLEEALGHYTAAIQWAMTHAAEENPCIQIFFD